MDNHPLNPSDEPCSLRVREFSESREQYLSNDENSQFANDANESGPGLLAVLNIDNAIVQFSNGGSF